jgi:hypothetical protein
LTKMTDSKPSVEYVDVLVVGGGPVGTDYIPSPAIDPKSF